MAIRNYPGLGLMGGFPTGYKGWGDAMNANVRELSSVVQLAVLDRVAALPGSPVDGDRYLLTAGPDADRIAIRDEGNWTYYTAVEGWLCYVADEDLYYTFNGTTWAELATTPIGGPYQPLDSDLSIIAGQANAAFGLSLLTAVNAAALRAAAGLGALAVQNDITASQISDASANGRSLVTAADYSAMRTLLGLVIGTNVQAQNAELAGLSALAANGIVARTAAGTYAGRTITGSAQIAVADGNGVAGNPTLTMPDGTVTLAKMANVNPRRLLGNPGNTAAAPSEISQGRGIQFRNGKLRTPWSPDTVARKVMQALPWAARTSAADNDFRNIAYSQELGIFVAVSVTGVGNRVMYSYDGGVWATAVTPADNNWQGVCWSPDLGLFVAVAGSGVGNRVMTSLDGVTWTIGVSSIDNDWRAVCWSGALGLFVAVAASGTGTRAMTSPDGLAWTTRTTPANLTWNGVCWAPEIGLLVAIAQSGTGNRVMTSPDGVTWTSRTSAADNNWNDVAWSPELGLLVTVAITGTGNRVMTSSDGITWTTRTTPADNQWRGVAWAPEIGLFMAVAASGVGNRAMYSRDGLTWALMTSGADNSWYGIAWAGDKGMFAAAAFSGTGNRIMTIAHNNGFYTPTLVNVANLAASVASSLIWYRVGTRVTVFGKVNVDPTTTALTTQLGIPLPLASTIATDSQIAGSGAAKAVAGMSVAVIGDTVNNRAQMEWVAGDVAARDVHFSFSYVVR